MTEWNQILRDEIYSPEEPDDFVIHFLSKLHKKQKKRILDLGCGRGRHVVYVATHGFEAHGIDASDTGLRATKKKIRDADAYLVKCDMRMLPYKRSCFDAVISLRTIYHQRLDDVQKTILEIKRILNRNGSILIDFLSKRTHSYGRGIFVEENTFIEEDGPEKGIIHYFVDREELEKLFKEFKCLNMELREKQVEGKLRSRWIVMAKM